ncbi:MAG TPA: hypothetical protein VKN35_11305, partial [Xanthomonadales bacterium]|nr:hypothetical protein [Xanthomonadales bacterium]
MTRTTICLPTVGLAAIMTLSACSIQSTSSTASVASTPQVGILVFGDSGYLLAYPDQDDYVDLFDEDEYKQKEWDDWQEDKRPPEEFTVRPMAVSPVT